MGSRHGHDMDHEKPKVDLINYGKDGIWKNAFWVSTSAAQVITPTIPAANLAEFPFLTAPPNAVF